VGGIGSGRGSGYGWTACTADYRRIDIREWRGEGFLAPGRSFSWHWTRGAELRATLRVHLEADRARLSYSHLSRETGWVSEELCVRLDWTMCHYGGQRAWFLCPACGRRVAVLYGSAVFVCRHCRRLAYPSQRENAGDRARRRAQDIRVRLGGTANMLEPFPAKPKGMRWRTYRQLLEAYNRLAGASFADMTRRLQAVKGMLATSHQEVQRR
jgi:hypothetical protein